MQRVQVQHLSSFAKTPTRGSSGSAGFDLYAAHSSTVQARGKALIKTDIAMTIPEYLYGRIAPRSGLAWKNSIDVGAGVIDSDYRGNIGVILFNHSDTDFIINVGDRIAQLIFEKIELPTFIEVREITETERGEKGFGSTGVTSGHF